MENILKNKKDAQEKCVVCGMETPYKYNTPINEREYYIEGAGQLCQKCHYELYVKKNG